MSETTDGFFCRWILGQLFTRLTELSVAPEEQHVYKFEFEVTLTPRAQFCRWRTPEHRGHPTVQNLVI